MHPSKEGEMERRERKKERKRGGERKEEGEDKKMWKKKSLGPFSTEKNFNPALPLSPSFALSLSLSLSSHHNDGDETRWILFFFLKLTNEKQRKGINLNEQGGGGFSLSRLLFF